MTGSGAQDPEVQPSESERFARVSRRIDVGAVEDFVVGQLCRVDVPGKDIWVLRAPDGSWYGVRNSCPHQGGPICLGEVDGTFLPSDVGVYEMGLQYEVIRCPYHRYEYSLKTGMELFTGGSDRLVRYEVQVEDSRVLISSKGM